MNPAIDWLYTYLNLAIAGRESANRRRRLRQRNGSGSRAIRFLGRAEASLPSRMAHEEIAGHPALLLYVRFSQS